jgi:uncharacterized protein YjbI with pentapeptide repeats
LIHWQARWLQNKSENPAYGIVNRVLIEPTASITNEELLAHAQWLESGGKSGRKIDETGMNLAGAALNDLNLAKGQFVGTTFTKANLAGTNLSGGDFSGANLEGANLTDTDFTYADLIAANLNGASQTGIKLAGAKLADTRGLK